MRFLLSLLLLPVALFAQDYPKDYFRRPLDIPLQLAGNFGELRNNHFHAGFDFRTQQREGLNVYASAEGYVSRIKYSAYGYGKAIYITHPNGYTTLYGHLQTAVGPIADFVKAYQYKNQVSEFEYFPKPEELPVKKGQIIALSGNTGGSEGPHLHFEIRDTKTENIINPYYFGFSDEIPDARKPVITALMVYPADDNSVANKSNQPTVLNLTKLADGNYLSQKVLAKGKIGFGVAGFDSDSNTTNPNGIFQINSFLNGNPSFGYTFSTFHFNETRYINALIDYGRYKSTSQRIQRLFMKNKYDLSLIRTDANNGLVSVEPNIDNVYRIEASDFAGNKTTISIPIEYADASALTPSALGKTPYFVEVSKDHRYEQGDYSFVFPAGTFYEDFYLDFDVEAGFLNIKNKNIPVHTPYTISKKDNVVSAADREKTFIGTYTGKNPKPSFNDTWYKDGAFHTKAKVFGKFGLAKDTTAPKISLAKPIEGKWLSKQRYLNIYMRDDLSGIKKYDAYLNGKWILLEYDYKKARLTHDFKDGIVANGRNELKVVVTDNVGNSAIFETYFFRNQ